MVQLATIDGVLHALATPTRRKVLGRPSTGKIPGVCQDFGILAM